MAGKKVKRIDQSAESSKQKENFELSKRFGGTPSLRGEVGRLTVEDDPYCSADGCKCDGICRDKYTTNSGTIKCAGAVRRETL